MIDVQNIYIEENIPDVKFSCNTAICKGACCTIAGGKGAPLLDEELIMIEQLFPIIKPYLSPEHIDAIIQSGLYEGVPGSYTTMCFNNRACVFVFYKDGIARCAFEKAFFEGKTVWQKPLSCHLFPIRIDSGMITRLRYEQISECDGALRSGLKNNIYLTSFLKEPLKRAFGSNWYEDLLSMCESRRKETKINTL
ncbi:MAG: DUF3109 family protein [Bacteroidetes bacterium]|nr:DUF3109 family protein [Bacteroidota bacterium]